jgi:hypothetical protein
VDAGAVAVAVAVAVETGDEDGASRDVDGLPGAAAAAARTWAPGWVLARVVVEDGAAGADADAGAAGIDEAAVAAAVEALGFAAVETRQLLFQGP